MSSTISAEDMLVFDQSQLVKSAKDILKNAMIRDVHHTKVEFTTARDYLLLSLCLDNACRTVTLADMTLGEIEASQFDDGTYKIRVLKNKTLSTSGPALVCATVDLMSDINRYILMRSKLNSVGTNLTDPVFITWNGSKMSSSTVTAQLNSFWGKAVGHTSERPRISGSLIRKSAVAKVHKEQKSMSKDLAKFMCHSEDTTQRALEENSQKAGEISAALRVIMRQQTDQD